MYSRPQTHSSGLSGLDFHRSSPGGTSGSAAFHDSRSMSVGMTYRIGGRNQPPIAQPGPHVSRRPSAWWFLAMRNSQIIVSTMRASCATTVRPPGRL